MPSGTEPAIPTSTDGSRRELSSYDVFLLALVVYSMLNLVLVILPLQTYQTRVVLIMDGAIGVLFFFDFLYRFFRAPDKRQYMTREWGWLDLLAGMPVPGFRLAKLVRLRPTIRTWRKQGLIRGLHRTSSNRATVALLIAIFSTFLVIQFGSILVIGPELRAADSNIHSAEEAVWWSYVTVTTVGYGDYYPVSAIGRLVGVLLLSLGIALFAVITSFLANAFIYPHKERKEDQRRASEQSAAILDLQATMKALNADIRALASDIQRLRDEDDQRQSS